MIYEVPFAVYERLASAKMNALLAAINSHTHDGTYGVKIPFIYIDGVLDPTTQLTLNSIDGDYLIDNSVRAVKLEDHSITMQQIDNTSSNGLKLDNDGYAVYAE